jgi:hypothetical protein
VAVVVGVVVALGQAMGVDVGVATVATLAMVDHLVTCPRLSVILATKWGTFHGIVAGGAKLAQIWRTATMTSMTQHHS